MDTNPKTPVSAGWLRLEQMFKWLECSPERFADEIGLDEKEELYRIKYEGQKISSRLLDLVAERYPKISIIWLATGEGEMFSPAPSSRQELFADKMVDVNVNEHGNYYHILLRIRKDVEPKLLEQILQGLQLGVTMVSREGSDLMSASSGPNEILE